MALGNGYAIWLRFSKKKKKKVRLSVRVRNNNSLAILISKRRVDLGEHCLSSKTRHIGKKTISYVLSTNDVPTRMIQGLDPL